MKKTAILAIVVTVLVGTGCAGKPRLLPGTTLEEKTFALPAESAAATDTSSADLKREIDRFNRHVGSWPPRFASDAERERVYRAWSQALIDTRAIHKQQGIQKRVY